MSWCERVDFKIKQDGINQNKGDRLEWASGLNWPAERRQRKRARIVTGQHNYVRLLWAGKARRGMWEVPGRGADNDDYQWTLSSYDGN